MINISSRSTIEIRQISQSFFVTVLFLVSFFGIGIAAFFLLVFGGHNGLAEPRYFISLTIFLVFLFFLHFPTYRMGQKKSRYTLYISGALLILATLFCGFLSAMSWQQARDVSRHKKEAIMANEFVSSDARDRQENLILTRDVLKQEGYIIKKQPNEEDLYKLIGEWIQANEKNSSRFIVEQKNGEFFFSDVDHMYGTEINMRLSGDYIELTPVHSSAGLTYYLFITDKGPVFLGYGFKRSLLVRP